MVNSPGLSGTLLMIGPEGVMFRLRMGIMNWKLVPAAMLLVSLAACQGGEARNLEAVGVCHDGAGDAVFCVSLEVAVDSEEIDAATEAIRLAAANLLCDELAESAGVDLSSVDTSETSCPALLGGNPALGTCDLPRETESDFIYEGQALTFDAEAQAEFYWDGSGTVEDAASDAEDLCSELDGRWEPA